MNFFLVLLFYNESHSFIFFTFVPLFLNAMKIEIPFLLKELEPGSFHPIVIADIDGVKVNLIIDSGASRTVIDSSLTANFLIFDQQTNEPFAAGINAQRIAVQQVELPSLNMGGFDFGTISVFSADLSPISNLYKEMINFPIHGLLGCDFLVRYKVYIDFKSQILVIRKGKRIKAK